MALQATNCVMSSIEESLYVARAVNCCESPNRIEALLGMTAIDVGASTVNPVIPVTVPDTARIMVVPAALAVTTPGVGGPEVIIATAWSVELQVTDPVMSTI